MRKVGVTGIVLLLRLPERSFTPKRMATFLFWIIKNLECIWSYIVQTSK